jgi:branched-subunit amino acid aminotransferase/4-amino-4-deoxychorismate lyase
MEPIVYLNGEYIPLSQAKISVMDNGFLFGYGVFIGMRVYHGKLFRLDSQLSRLKNYSEKIGISADIGSQNGRPGNHR